jgi:predicted nucleotidyltransferase
MDEQQVRGRLAGLKDQLTGLGVRSLLLFGSAATGKATPASDLDFLVQFNGPATFDGYMSLKELLEREFETTIDLVTERALKPVLRDQILAEAVRVS